MKKIIFVIITFLIGASLYAEEVNKQNVSGEIANTECVKSDGIIYMKLGFSSTFGKFKGKGPSIGFGYRHEMEDLAVDFGLFNYMIRDPKSSVTGEMDKMSVVNYIQIQVLYFFSPVDNGSFYAGGGLAHNVTNSKHYHYNKWDYEWEYEYGYFFEGVAGVSTFGYEIMRDSPNRYFIQLEATMPFGKMKNDDSHSGSYYEWSLALSVGVGF